MVGHFDFHFSNEKGLPAKQNKTKQKIIIIIIAFWNTGKCEPKVRILVHNFEQFFMHSKTENL